MIFWILAAVALAIAAFITFLPLFRPKTGWTPIALALIFLLPAGALMLYPYIGTPEGLDQVAPAAAPATQAAHTSESSEMDAMVDNLRARLTESPEHLEGWMLLSKTLKTMQRYPEALEALETAHRIAPEDPYISVELIEARIFVSGQGQIDNEMITVLEDAVARDPSQQKGLWLLGVASSQSGYDAKAIEYWQTLVQQLEPGTSIAGSVQKQISQAQNRLGIEQESSAEMEVIKPDVSPKMEVIKRDVSPKREVIKPDVSAEREGIEQDAGADQEGIKLHLSASDELKANMPSSAILFIIIRSAGPVGGPPLGVRRISNPVLPLELTISDRDSMMAERKISSESELRLQARLSLSGAPNAQSGDWQSAAVTVPLKTTETVQLVIDQRVD
jgi:cytochrome c-type biogenesis protein CcmH